MKLYSLICLVCLALLGVPTSAEDLEIVRVPEIKVRDDDAAGEKITAEVVVEVDSDEDIDVEKILGDLVEYQYEEEEEELNREERDLSRVEAAERKHVTDRQVIEKYNKFVDAFLNRLSTSMRQSRDPMRLVIRKSGKISLEDDGNPKGNRRNNRRNKNKGANGKKNKRRHPKDLGVVSETSPDETKASLRQKREILSEGDENIDYEYDDDEYYDYAEEDLDGRALESDYELDYEDDYEDYDLENEEETETDRLREGREIVKGGEVRDAKEDENGRSAPKDEARRRGGRRRRRRKGRGRCKKACRRRKRRNRLRKRRLRLRRNRRRGKRATESPFALVSGISNIRRTGDVRITEGQNFQDIEADFELGPIVLRAQKSYGKGSNQDLREARATASNVQGQLIIKVHRNGNARVKKLRILRPTNIEVTGTLRKRENLSSDKAMEGFVKRTRPLISRTLKQEASKIFRSSNENARSN